MNSLPQVKTFLKQVSLNFIAILSFFVIVFNSEQPGHADSYVNLKVSFVAGKVPQLFIRDDSGNLMEKVDLASVYICFDVLVKIK